MRAVTATTTSVCGVIRALHMTVTSSSHRVVKRLILIYKIDTSHFKITPEKRFASEPLLIVRSQKVRVKATDLTKALISIGRPYACEKCGLKNVWNEEPIVLQIDHRNGLGYDNRPENLRFLCPNCHSQTPNFGAKNRRVFNKTSQVKCRRCTNTVPTHNQFYCSDACAKEDARQYHWPDPDALRLLLEELPLSQVRKKLGLKSDNSVRKLCKSYGIKTKPRGFWAKKFAGPSAIDSHPGREPGLVRVRVPLVLPSHS